MSKKKEKNCTPPIPTPDILKGVVGSRLDDEAGKDRFPSIFDLVVPRYDDKRQITQEGKISITIRGNHWEVRIDLPTYVLTGVMMPGSLATALEDLEAAISSKRIVWSPGFTRNKKKLPTIDEA